MPWACKEPLYTLGSGQLVDSNQSVTYLSTKLLPEDFRDALKHVGVLRLYKILLLYRYCAFVVLDNGRYMYKNTSIYFLRNFSTPIHYERASIIGLTNVRIRRAREIKSAKKSIY
jgi:hypothetical protein